MMITDGIGVYVHVPFCVRKCNYCDFASYAGMEGRIGAYVDRLISEIESYRTEERIPVNTVYVGGGTPSLLPSGLFRRIVDAISDVFLLSDKTEFTVEANPGAITRDKALAYKELGVNRISLGLQSIHENEMKILGRIHNYDDFLNTFHMLREVGFDNLNVDLMYSIPEQTEESFAKTLDEVLILSPEHISAYSLIIEDGTPFAKHEDKLNLPSEDAEIRMYDFLCNKLREFGYNHYEISNYAKPGRESRHNLKYWNTEEYIGVGLAAHSYFNGARFANPRELDSYMKERRRSEYIELSDEDARFEYAMMRLRLACGMSLSEYRERFAYDFLLGKEDKLRELSERGLLSLCGDNLALTEKGFYLSNYILTEIL